MAETTQTVDRFEGGVPAALPLALLEAVRAHDIPPETIEDENLTLSLPRRLGLTDVVWTQMRRFEAAQRAGRPVRMDEVVPLMRLVLRRPDAALIMDETGRRFAAWHFERRPAALRTIYPKLPVRLSSMYAVRGIRKALKLIHAGSAVTIARQPLHVRIDRCLALRVDPTGAACPLFTGIIAEEYRLYTGRTAGITIEACATTPDGSCEWREADDPAL